ncbi:DUF2935 domain-containing protein [Bacillus sp. DTU_2020_1000418_1_SI_GHA_SEK_038]|uniref:DUF2935 domain-containing protein n=1 Tax=Bacillus sp. DTU_2020_1000418_1_SI_GHA_SEK_038 TaxID=3077585 RepID=UPI0028E7AAC9|nr:DUF2935 domain-containing protein [Bacillus sp. DTU_2020_1000418_1_SI_GHA_SEK_038]WNS73810.1 DUF2935 domain-containing protein [Bacillus sp. DTU_2020_1000418_1_SI_GHA_SEK_038]
MAASFEKAAKFEHGFWLQVLGDHARFILDSLAPSEKEFIQEANYFIGVFDQLLGRVEAENLLELSLRADEEAKKIRQFKLTILERHLVGKVKIHLGPTFMNHMVNEVDEYLLILKYLKNEEAPPIFHELHHHLLWLLDAAGHAGAISDNMELPEKRIKKLSDTFTKDFEAFYLKAVELTGFLRTNLSSFPALQKFNKDVSLEMKLFMNFLDEIEELRLSKEALGTFSALMADHMFREECYYLTKLAESTQAEKPDCNPAKPRLKE